MNKVVPGKEKNGKGVSFKCCSLNFENDLVVFVCMYVSIALKIV